MNKKFWMAVVILEVLAIFGYAFICNAAEVVYTNGFNHKHDFFKCTEEADTQKVEEHMKNRTASVVDLSNLNARLQFLTKENSVIYMSSDNGETIKFVLVYNEDTNEFVRY